MEKKRQKIRLANAVAQIRRHYPKITPESIRFAAMVFYPVALVEVVAWEKSVEDFDSVQLMILRFISLRMGQEEIAELTGLTPAYIAKIKELLYGYGHITPDGTITELGRESIEYDHGNGKKVEYKESKRHVQLDALSLSIIPYEKSVDETTFYEKSLAHGYQVGVISYPEGIDAQTLEMQLKKIDYQEITGASDIHVNIVSISEMRCLKLRYAISCMLCLDGSNTPIVFGRRKGQKKASTLWIPFGIESEQVRQCYGFEDISIVGLGDAARHLNSMKARFDERWEFPLKKAARETNPKPSKQWNMPLSTKERGIFEAKALLEGALDLYPFAQNSYQWNYQEQGGTLIVSSESFADSRRVSSMARILLGFAMDGVFSLTTEKLCGRIVTVRPMENDKLLQDVIDLLQNSLKQSKGYTVDRYLKSRFGDGSDVEAENGNSLLERLKHVLSDFLSGTPLEDDSI